MKNKVHAVVTKIQACDDTTSIKAENRDTNNFVNLEWFFVHFFLISSCIYFKLRKLPLHAATNEMSFSVCNYYQNTVKAKGIPTYFQCQQI